jgi:peptidoglycan/LPS O-acetylase OafA/YrhL
VAVLIFHIWPDALPGGYVGVDVFFVISGYLITGLLLRDAEQNGRISLGRFYQRRIRRLLPAAMLVIVVAALSFPLLPQAQWSDLSREVLSSAFYVQNWWLVAQAVDYLAEDNAPGMLQHYWSLSVEEQYYIVWPLIAWLLISRSASARARPARSLFVVTVLLGGLSFLYSALLVRRDPALAYFVTTTRAWELAIGGLLATSRLSFERLPGSLRVIVGWSGLGMIGIACALFGSGTPFPGYAAALPTVGAALVLVAAQTQRSGSSYWLLQLRPLQFLGDISYSLYLWHWPLLIVWRAMNPVEEAISLPHGAAIGMAAIVLAWLSKVWVEDPFRHGTPIWRGWAPSPVAIFVTSAGLAFVNSFSIAMLGRGVEVVPVADPGLLTKPYDPKRPTVPSFKQARNDNPDVYKRKCHVNQVSSEPLSCTYGVESAPRVAVLIGDSHAAQWAPALQTIYKNRPDWRLVTFTKSACAFNAAAVTLGKERRPYDSCTEWNGKVLAEVERLRPEVVVVSAAAGYTVQGIDDREKNLAALSDGLLVRWRQLWGGAPRLSLFATLRSWTKTCRNVCQDRGRR